MTFGEKIQILRKDAGMSQEELAERLDVSRQAISKWERGAGYPETEKLIRMSRLFGVSLDYLFGEDEDQPRVTPEPGLYINEETARGFLAYEKRKKLKKGAALCSFGVGFACALMDADIGLVMFVLLLIAGIILLVSAKQADDPYRELRKQPLRLEKGLRMSMSAEYSGLSRRANFLSLAGLAMALAGFLLMPLLAPVHNYRLDNLLLQAGFVMAGAGLLLRVYFSGLVKAYRVLIMNEEYRKKEK